MKANDQEDKALEALRNIIKDVSFIESVEERPGLQTADVGWNRQMQFRLADQEVILLVEVMNSGEPRFARNAVNQLLRLQRASPSAYGVLIAPWISPAAASICQEAGVGYVDLAGNCRLTFGTIHVERSGKPNPFTTKRDLRSLYSPKASRILRVLLDDPRRAWKLQALADEAGVSLGQTHKVKSLLLDREWLRSDTQGIALSKPAELLAEWASNYSLRNNKSRLYYTQETVGKAEEGLAAACSSIGLRYALAAFSAASRYAPFVRYQRAHAYVEEDCLDELVQSLHLKEAPSGANLVLWIPYDDGIWYGTRVFAEAQVTSDIQTYLDLQSMHERGTEAARFLLEQEIKPRW
ncbi:type IV toxin-antitoxin system AbiEi family antitoxin [Candidatus Amarolinea aalborgensis]|uniref:type IV toxin-antitoxin system AbiEi family antitoxin n=1 Tax=Candidatus Amarolinea aalborgensis TaxID=2249329 RepID=UPI003BF9E55B